MMMVPQKTFFMLLVLVATSAHADDCSDAYEVAYKALTHAKNGYRSLNLADVRQHAQKAIEALDSAITTADECGCDDAVKTAETANSLAWSAYQSTDFQQARGLLEKSAEAATRAMNETNDCSGY